MKVLIVDDDVISRKILKATCLTLGCRVVEATDGKEAWELFNRYPVQIVISDWIMPEMDGLTLCQKIRHCSKGDYVFFFIITGKKTALEDFSKAREAGADDFIFKPIDYHVFRNQLAVAERMLNLIKDHLEEFRRLKAERVISSNLKKPIKF